LTITINVNVPTNNKVNVPVKVTAEIVGAKNINWFSEDPTINKRVALDNKSMSFTPSKTGVYKFKIMANNDTEGVEKGFTVVVGNIVIEPIPVPTPTPTPEPTPTPTPTGEVIYDSKIHSKLHDGKVRTITQEGNITAGGLGVECRASGSPKIVVNTDGTFSLICGSGHGRFYGYVLNYNATLEIECAFWNEASGQDCSLKMRSRHNEGGAESNRFGGYGLSIDRAGWGSKVEQFHNEHSESSSGSLPSKPETGKYFKVEFTVKDSGSGVELIGKYNGTQFMKKTVKKYQDKTIFDKQSYFWVRSNIDSGTGELRIKQVRILKS